MFEEFDDNNKLNTFDNEFGYVNQFFNVYDTLDEKNKLDILAILQLAINTYKNFDGDTLTQYIVILDFWKQIDEILAKLNPVQEVRDLPYLDTNILDIDFIAAFSILRVKFIQKYN